MGTPPTPQAAVRTSGLGRRFGRLWALSHVELEVGAGETLMVAGANGSGKTTLLRLLAGLERPSAGSVAILGVDPRRETLTCRRSVTMVSHHGFLYERLTALEMLRFWCAQAGSEAGRETALALLAEVGLAAAADQQVGGFSAGMRKRLTLLRTRVESPRVILWDEPFSALDPAGRELMADWVRGFGERGATTLLATHDIELGAQICRRAAVLAAGQLRWIGPSAEVPGALEALR
jgi:heme ABC exporter ATP-binding subunit CcmA